MKTSVELVAECLPSLDEAISRSKVVEAELLDSRDAIRLAQFVPEGRFEEIGVQLQEGMNHEPLEWNAENVTRQLASDVDFAFEKGLNQRGISASLMAGVLEMWQRILDPGLVLPGYAQYGLPIAKAMAVRFNLPNRIGDDHGDERQYASD